MSGGIYLGIGVLCLLVVCSGPPIFLTGNLQWGRGGIFVQEFSFLLCYSDQPTPLESSSRKPFKKKDNTEISFNGKGTVFFLLFRGGWGGQKGWYFDLFCQPLTIFFLFLYTGEEGRLWLLWPDVNLNKERGIKPGAWTSVGFL